MMNTTIQALLYTTDYKSNEERV